MLWQFPTENLKEDSFAYLAAEFLLWVEADQHFSRETVEKYRECLKHVWMFWGERQVSAYNDRDLLALRQHWRRKNLSVSRETSLLLALKRFLLFCKVQKGIALQIIAEQIRPPRRPRREVQFLTTEEIAAFIDTIPLTTYRGSVHSAGLRLRALVEVLLGSAMRVSEALSLNRDDVDFKQNEARIIGKGNKERVVFFTERALLWLRRYLESRTDECPALFTCQNGRTRLRRGDLWRYFDRHRKLAGVKKRVTPHILRHTAATQLLFNGCPVGHIKEILGHERLETTCRYYLGLDRRAAKTAHAKYLRYV